MRLREATGDSHPCREGVGLVWDRSGGGQECPRSVLVAWGSFRGGLTQWGGEEG